jgi:glycosyltransferase involved in cell wall biosynthesis
MTFSKEQNIAVTVLMPAYNAEKHISTAIESILGQTYKDFEFLIIDDGSQDKTWEVIQKYAKTDKRIVSVKNDKNLKLAGVFNQGIQLANGEYIARMDSDDWSYPTRLEKQLEFLKNNPETVIVGCRVEICHENLEKIYLRNYGINDREIRGKIFRFSPFCHPAIMARRNTMLSCGGYNPLLILGEDYDIYFRLGKKGKFANLPETLFKLRLHNSSTFRQNLKLVRRNTLYVRLKAVVEYEYKMSFIDKIIFIGQYLIFMIVPQKYLMKLFNLVRNYL